MDEVHFGWFLLVLDIIAGYLGYFVPGHPLYGVPLELGVIAFALTGIVALALITTGKHGHEKER